MRLHFFEDHDHEKENPTREVEALTISGASHELRLLADFLNSCADDIDENGAQFQHRNFKDEPPVMLEESAIPKVQVSRCV